MIITLTEKGKIRQKQSSKRCIFAQPLNYMNNLSNLRKPVISISLLFILVASVISCRRDDDMPKPEIVPIYIMFRLFQLNNTDTLIAGWGYLNQTVSDNAQIAIKLDEAFRKSTGEYNITLHTLAGSSAGNAISNIGTMPANAASWESKPVKPNGSNEPFSFQELRKPDSYLVKIMQNNTEVVRGELGLAW